MGRARLRGNSPTCSTLPPREITPPPSLHGDWDTETAMSSSRPTSLAIPRTASPVPKLPCLGEILSNTAPPPWTLSAFTAFLSQNHCLETLEFLTEAERYRKAYETQPEIQNSELSSVNEHVCALWHRVMQAYIMPYSPREVNLPAPVRDRLLELECSSNSIPTPSVLNEAVGIIHELMSDSLLFPFLQSMTSQGVDGLHHKGEASEERRSRSRLRIPRDLLSSSSSDEGSQSPKTGFLPLLLGRSSPVTSRSGSGSGVEAMDVDLVTDDSNSPNTTPGAEPMTPPTTPPTSEFMFHASPNTLQRAISGNSWKRMGARLGLGRRNRSVRRSQPTNTTSAGSASERLSYTVSGPAAS